MRDIPIGIDATGTRRERDGWGAVDVPADRYWGACTQRSLNVLGARSGRIPPRFHGCYAIVKKAAAIANGEAGRLPASKIAAIGRAADEVAAGLLTDHFPLPVWQSGSGHETDTNINEVLANRANQLLGGAIGSRKPVHPFGDVNMGQEVDTCFTIAMHIAIVLEVEQTLAPPAEALLRSLDRMGMPAYARRMRDALARIDEAEGGLHEIMPDLATKEDGPRMSHEDWRRAVGAIAAATGKPFILSQNVTISENSLDAIVFAMAAVRGFAAVLTNISQAISERSTPGRAPGAGAPFEAMAMTGFHVIALDGSVSHAVTRGNRAPYAMRPLVIAAALDAVRMLGEACGPMRSGLRKLR